MQMTVSLALKYRLPSLSTQKSAVQAGILMSYSASLAERGHEIARYVDKILKGAKPADLPVQQPTRYELAINLKTAKTLGVARLDVDLRPRTRPVPGFTGSRFLSRQPGILAGRTIFRGTRARGQCLQGAGREKTLRCRGCGRSLPVAFLPTMIAAPITSAGRFSPRGPFGHCGPFTYGILLKGGA
jgi:ABC transporter substrate binding protein